MYNLKIITFPNGEVQARWYEKPIRSPEDDTPLLDGYEGQSLFADIRDAEKARAGGGVDAPTTVSADTPRECDYHSASRAKQAVYTYSRCYSWEWFITITFKPQWGDRFDYDKCSKALRVWLHNQRTRYAPDLKYLVIPEQHKNGAWHFHGLLADCGKMVFWSSGHRDRKSGDMIFNMVKWQNGFTTATRVRDIHRVAKYVGKYITKSLCDLTPGRQRYFVSNNLPLPKVALLLASGDPEDEVRRLAAKMGKKVAHVSDNTRAGSDSYCLVKYFELQ